MSRNDVIMCGKAHLFVVGFAHQLYTHIVNYIQNVERSEHYGNWMCCTQNSSSDKDMCDLYSDTYIFLKVSSLL